MGRGFVLEAAAVAPQCDPIVIISSKLIAGQSKTDEEIVLACLKAGGEAEWQQFVQRFHPHIAGAIYHTARRTGRMNLEAIEDIVQDVYIRLFAARGRLLREFVPRHEGAWRAYIRAVAASTALDALKRESAECRGGGIEPAAFDEQVIGAARATKESPEDRLMLDQIDAFLRSPESGISARDRRIFWLHHRHRMSASDIAEIPAIGLRTKGVETAILRATRTVRERFGSAPPGSKQ